jgi:DNA-binding MarR family transcriptional regulator
MEIQDSAPSMAKTLADAAPILAATGQGAGHPPSWRDQKRLELRILQALRRIMQAVDIHSRKLSSQYKITTPQLVALLCVVDDGPITPTDIARQVHLSNSTIVGILDRLEQKGLIARERSTTDRRLVNITATEAGRELAESAPSPLQDVFADALRGLPELEQTAIALSLERIVELMEARHLDASPVLTHGEMKPSL